MPQTYRECNDLLRTMLRRNADARSPPSWGGAGVCSTLVVFLVTFMSLLALTGFASFLALARGGGGVAWWGTPVTAAAAATGGGVAVNITENLPGEEEGRGRFRAGASADDRSIDSSTVRRTAVSVDDLSTTPPGVSNYFARVTPGRATDREWTETTPPNTSTRRIPVPVPVVSEGNVTRKNNDPMSIMSDQTWKRMTMTGGSMPHRSGRRRRMRKTRRRGLQNDGRSRTIQTTLDSNGKSFGSMFVLHNNNPEGNDLLIETLSVHLDLEPPTSTRVEVYSRLDSYVGYEDGPVGWTVVCNATVRSMGEGQVTFVPVDEFDTVTISWGGAHAFYVTLPTENMLHTTLDDEDDDGMGSGSVYASNDDVSILTGAAVWDHSFGPSSTADDPAVFNGEVRYNLAPAAARSGNTPPPTASPPPLGYKSVPERCTTTFDEDNGAYGAYFTVFARRRIRVTSIDFHTDKTHDLQVNVYTREGDYRGHEYDRDAWTIVASTTVKGAGSGRPTPISSRGSGGDGGGGRPPLIDDGVGDSDTARTGNFLPVDVMEGRSQSFFVTLSTEDLRYSNTDEPIGSTIVSTSAIDVLVGTGSSGYPVGYPPFDPSNRLFNSRMFNGVVHYLTAVSEDYPSIYPYPATLVTTLEGGTRGFGAMFDVVAKVPTGAKVLITGIDFHTDLDRDMPTTSVEVYTKLGSYAGFEDDPGAWTRIAEVDGVTGSGPGMATPIMGGSSGVGVVGGDGGVVRPGSSTGVVGDLGEGQRPTVTMQDRSAGGTTVISPFFDPVTVDSDQTRSFYVTLPTTNMSYTTLDPSLLGSDFTSDDNLRVLVGVGVAYPFGGGVGRTYFPRMFNGAVHYAVADPPPTAAPSSMPSTSSPTPQPTFAPAAEPATPLVTQQKIQIAGVSARRLLKGARIVGGSGGKRRLELAEESVGFFENVTQQFLADEARKSGVNVQKATVATELDLDDVEGLEEGASDEGADGGAADDADGDGGGGGGGVGNNSSSAPVLDLYTTIEGEYRPPPYVDFGVLVEDTFEEKGDVFVEELKEDPTGFFEEATGVETVQVSFPLPAPPEPPVQRSNAKLIAGVSGGCGGVFLLVVAAVIVLFVLKKRRRRKRAAASAEDYSECKSFDDSFEEDSVGGHGDDKSGKSNGSRSEQPGVYRSSSLDPSIRKVGSGDWDDDATDDDDGGGRRGSTGSRRGKLRRRNSQERVLRRRSSSSSLEPIREESNNSIRTQ